MSDPIEFGISMDLMRGAKAEARRAEELGYDYLLTGEHVMFHTPVGNTLVGLAAAAGATERISRTTAWARSGYEAGVVGHRMTAQAVADENWPFQAQHIHQSLQVGHEVEHRISAGVAGPTVAPGVEGHHPVAVGEGRGQQFEAPGQVGHPVEKHNVAQTSR